MCNAYSVSLTSLAMDREMQIEIASGGVGGGGYLTKFNTGEAPPPRSNPLPFYIPFWQKRYPFYIPFIERGTPKVHIPTLGSLVLIFM